MSKSSAVGIGSSIYLSFTFPEVTTKEEDEEVPITINDAPKPMLTTQLNMFAIPVIDGVLIENEGTLARVINAKLSSIACSEGFSVALLNDF